MFFMGGMVRDVSFYDCLLKIALVPKGQEMNFIVIKAINRAKSQINRNQIRGISMGAPLKSKRALFK